MENYKGIDYLRNKLAQKELRVKLRYSFYEMKNITRDLNISTPPDLRFWMGCLGWSAKAVDALADRLVFREFANDNFGLNEIYELNNRDVLFDSSINGALISACDFIYISADESGVPRLQVIDGANATGIIDPITHMLQEGYAVLQRDNYGNAILEAHFIKGTTIYYDNGRMYRSEPNKAPYPLLVPIIYRPDAVRPFGHSRISRACMSIQSGAIRTIKRSEISAEFFSFPQKYVNGLSENAEQMDSWKAAMSAMMAFTKDEDGDKPVIGQFQQQTMTPHMDQLKMFASLFAGETGLTLDDLGFPSDNPMSAEAIRASHETLRLTARKAQRTFGTGFLNAGYLAACVRDNFPYERSVLYLTTPKWEPIFEPDATALSGLGDAVIKIQQAFPDYFTDEKLRDLTGI